MPYIITHIDGRGDGWPCNTPSRFPEIRQAVATIEGARDAAVAIVQRCEHEPGVFPFGPFLKARGLRVNGRTVIELPDNHGSIEVRYISDHGFRLHCARLDGLGGFVPYPNMTEYIEAYNRAQDAL